MCVRVSQVAARRPMLSEFCSSRRIWSARTDGPAKLTIPRRASERRPTPIDRPRPGSRSGGCDGRHIARAVAPAEIEVDDAGDQRVSPGGDMIGRVCVLHARPMSNVRSETARVTIINTMPTDIRPILTASD